MSVIFQMWRRYRTPVLAVVTTALLVWSTVAIFDVSWRVVLEMLVVCVLGISAIIVMALCASLVLRKLRGY